MERTRDWNKGVDSFEEKGKKAESGGGEKGCTGLKDEILGWSQGAILVGTRVRWVKVKRTFAKQGSHGSLSLAV